MGHKKRRKAATLDPSATAGTIATPNLDALLDGSASIAPVDAAIIDHAAHAAAVEADAVAHEIAAAVPVTSDAPDPAPKPHQDGSDRPHPDRTAATSELGDALELYAGKALELTAANLSAAGDLVSALLGARSLPEAAAINARFVRRSVDAMTSGSRDLVLLAQTLAFGTAQSPDGRSRKP